MHGCVHIHTHQGNGRTERLRSVAYFACVKKIAMKLQPNCLVIDVYCNVCVFLFLPAAAAESSLKLLSDVAQAVKGRGTISWIDCGYVVVLPFTLPPELSCPNK